MVADFGVLTVKHFTDKILMTKHIYQRGNPMKLGKNNKRSTPTIYQSKKKKVKGFVDRVESGIVVVVIRDPEDPEYVKEIYIPTSKFPKSVPKEGDYISVTINTTD